MESVSFRLREYSLHLFDLRLQAIRKNGFVGLLSERFARLKSGRLASEAKFPINGDQQVVERMNQVVATCRHLLNSTNELVELRIWNLFR
jgi:hypothetical protein